MKIKQAWKMAASELAVKPDIEDPAFESEVLLRHILHIERAQFFFTLDTDLKSADERQYLSWIDRRLQGEPTAYILNCREFFGLKFYVDKRVLIPRPETELLVEEATKEIQIRQAYSRNQAGIDISNPLIIADIGTGSGVIAICLAVSLQKYKHIKIYATDVSEEALEVASLNCQRNQVEGRVLLLHGDLLSPLSRPVDILISNLPYVNKVDLAQMPSAKYEPGRALDGGESGLDQILRLCDQIKGKLKPGGCTLLEVGMGQSRPVSAYLKSLFSDSHIELIPDLAGIDRVVKMVLKPQL